MTPSTMTATATTTTLVRRRIVTTAMRATAPSEQAAAPRTSPQWELRFSGRSLVVALLAPILTSYSVGLFVRIKLGLIPAFEEVPLTTTDGDPPKRQAVLPNLMTDRPIPKTSYSARHFDTSVTVTSESRLARRRQTDDACQDDSSGDQCVALMNGEQVAIDNNEPAGEHILIDIKNVDESFLNSEERLAQAMVDLVERYGTVMLSYHCHKLEPMGVSCVGVMMKSHVSFHTWPEEGVITLDLFTAAAAAGDDSTPSLLTLLPAFEDCFGVPRVVSPLNRRPAPPASIWSFKKRGYPYTVTGEGSAGLTRLLGRMQLEKTLVSTSETSGVAVWEFRDNYRPFLGSTSNEKRRDVMDDATTGDRMIFNADGVLQARRFGNEARFEALVHPNFLAHSNPRRVAILGDGNACHGATLREVLKHDSVNEVYLFCEFDSHSEGSCYEDTRVRQMQQEWTEWLTNKFLSNDIDSADLFDVVIIEHDIPITKEIATVLHRALGNNGVLALPISFTGRASDSLCRIVDEAFSQGLAAQFYDTGFASVIIYSDASSQHGRLHAPTSQGFVAALKGRSLETEWYAPQPVIYAKLHRRLRLDAQKQNPLRYFDETVMASLQQRSEIVKRQE